MLTESVNNGKLLAPVHTYGTTQFTFVCCAYVKEVMNVMNMILFI